MNEINVGLSKKIRYPNGGFLLIDDKVRRIKPRHPHEAVRVFDHKKHSFNLLEDILGPSPSLLADTHNVSPATRIDTWSISDLSADFQ